MRTWLVRAALSFWIPLYLGVFHNFLVAPLVFYLGTAAATAIATLAIGVWSSILYFLLCQGHKLDKAQHHLTQLREKQERGLLARIGERLFRHPSRARGWFAKQLSEKLLPSPLRIFLVFVYPGPPFGVWAVKAAYSAKGEGEAFALIWAGCIANAFFWTVLGLRPTIGLLQRLARIILGGG